jgi:hypothetical protein
MDHVMGDVDPSCPGGVLRSGLDGDLDPAPYQ